MPVYPEKGECPCHLLIEQVSSQYGIFEAARRYFKGPYHQGPFAF
jgi:hypothetical protein